jgi:hypothetical protein
MLDVFAVADLLVAEAREAYGEDVAIIVYYGSYATSSASQYSDLDMYYIPDDGKAESLYRTFVIEDLPFEFWPVSWGFAQRVASAKHHWSVAPSLIANGRILYSRSAEDLARFNALKAQIAELQKPENKALLVLQALETYKTVAFQLDKLRLARTRHDRLGTRWAGCNLVEAVLDCLALVNQTFFTRNWASHPEQVLSLTIRPEHLKDLIEATVTAGDPARIEESAEMLARETREILVREQQCVTRPFTVASVFRDDFPYPAIKEYVNKIVSACEKRNLIGASYVAAIMQHELAYMLAQAETGVVFLDFNLYDEYGGPFQRLPFPDLASAIEEGDFAKIAEQARLFDRRAQEYYAQHGVSLNVVASMDDLEAFIRKKP